MTEATGLLGHAETEYRRGNLVGAAGLCRQVLANRPRDVPTLVLLGRVCAAADRPESAEKYLTDALAIAPGAVEAHLAMSDLKFSQGNLDGGIHHATEAARLDPRNVETRTNLGHRLTESGRHAEAVQVFEGCLKLTDRGLAELQNLATALAKAGRRDESMQVWQQLSILAPVNEQVWRHLSEMHLADGNTQEAVRCGNLAVSLSPRDPEAKRILENALAALAD